MNQKGLSKVKTFERLKEKEVSLYHQTMRNKNTYSKRNLLSINNNQLKPNIAKNASKNDSKNPFVLFQKNVYSPQILQLLSIPCITQWSFITKSNIKKTKDNKATYKYHKGILSENTNASSVINSLAILSPSIKPFNSSCEKTTKRKYYSTRSNYNMNHNSVLFDTATSHRKCDQGKSVSSFRHNNSTANINNSAYYDNKKEFYIKYQKIPYLKSLNLSTMSVSSPTITTYNVDICSSKRLKVLSNKDNNNDILNNYNIAYKAEEQKYFMNNQLSILKDDDYISKSNNKINNPELSTIETGNYNNYNNTNGHSNYYLAKKKINFDNFINIKLKNDSSNLILNDPNEQTRKANLKSKNKGKKQGIIYDYNEFNEFQFEYYLNQINRKNFSISPNKRLLSSLFNNKDKLTRHSRSLPLLQKTITKRRNDNNTQHKKNNSCYTLSNNTQFTYEGIPLLQKKIVYPHYHNNNLKGVKQLEIYHNDNINIVNNDNIRDKINIPILPIDEVESIDVDFTMDDLHKESLTQIDQINHINVHKIPHFENQIKSLSSLSIKQHKQIESIAPIEFKETEISINKLKPIDSGRSINDSSDKIKIHFENSKNKHQLNPSKKIKPDADSIPLKPKFLSMEELLEEVKLITKEKFNTISSFDLTNPSFESINYLFHLNNQNISYIKMLISVEAIIPKGNMKRFTILKKNASLQDILLNELVEINTKKEKADNINLITELIGNSDLILSEIMKY